MSSKKSSFNKIIKNNCNHKDEFDKNKNRSYFYCYKCNNIILIDNDKIYCTYKSLMDDEDFNDEIELDPISVVRLMVKRQEEHTKNINDKFSSYYDNDKDENETSNNNNEKNDNSEDIKSIKESVKSKKYNDSELTNIDDLEYNDEDKKNYNKNINHDLDFELRNEKIKFTKLNLEEEVFKKYENNRNRVLFYVHKLCTKLKYNDCSFYLCLYLLDTYLSRIYSDDITQKELLLVVLGFFLISAKYIENDIFEPELQIFCNIEKSIMLTIEEILISEVQCLTLINYNLYLYSVYDWLNILLSNGICFENELKNKDEIGDIYIYTQKLLTVITSKSYFYKYTSAQIAFSIIQLSREKYLGHNGELSKKIYKLLLSIYGIELSDYEECYNVIKNDLDKNYESEDEEEEEEENNTTKRNTISNNKTNTTLQNSNTSMNPKANTIEINKTKNISSNTLKEEKSVNMSNLNSERKNKFMLSQDTNKLKNFKGIENKFNLKIKNNTKNKFKLNLSGLTNFEVYKRKLKSNEKHGEYSSNNSIDVFSIRSKKFSNYMINNNNNNNSIHNTSIKSCNYVPKDDKKHITSDLYRNDKSLVLTGKNAKKNKTSFFNNAPKLSIKNRAANINNINYINNINIYNEIINLYSGDKKKKMHKNSSSGLNFNFIYKLNDNNNNKNNILKKNNYKVKKSLFTLGNPSQGTVKFEYNIKNINNINNINNFNTNDKVKNNRKSNHINITTSQDILTVNDTITNKFKNNNKIDPNKKEKYKTLLLLDIPNNQKWNILFKRNENNPIMKTEKENKSCSKYTSTGYINNTSNSKDKSKHKNKNDLKIHINGKNNIKIMNTNININLGNHLSSRKFTINFKDIVNKKINMQRKNNFMSKNNNNNVQNNKNDEKIKNYKSLNSNKGIANNKDIKDKKNYKTNNNSNNKSITIKDNILVETKSSGVSKKSFNKNKDFGSIILNNKNLALLNAMLPRLKMKKKSFINHK